MYSTALPSAFTPGKKSDNMDVDKSIRKSRASEEAEWPEEFAAIQKSVENICNLNCAAIRKSVDRRALMEQKLNAAMAENLNCATIRKSLDRRALAEQKLNAAMAELKELQKREAALLSSLMKRQ